MRTLERGPKRESLNTTVMSVAQTYGFGAKPGTITRGTMANTPDEAGRDTALIATLAGEMGHVSQTTQAWATAKNGGGTNIVFAAASPNLSIAQAFVVKASLSTVEAAGFTDPVVRISSVGDQESRKRYLRELNNFFKKNAKDLPEEVLDCSTKDPDSAARILTEEGHALKDSLPRTIDYLSESSRKIMVETMSLFESLGIEYELDARLPYTPEVHRELIFAVDALDAKGNVLRLATGSRYHEDTKGKKKERTDVIGMSVTLDEALDMRAAQNDAKPACFIVHVGEAAKMQAFTLLDSLWRAHVALDQALLSDTIQTQMERAKEADARYVAIIGQREALDGTVILKNTDTQLQETIPMTSFVSRMGRVRA